jgi:hypothetical protein
MTMRMFFWKLCGLVFDHMLAGGILAVRGSSAAKAHLRSRIYGWPVEQER